MSVWIKIAALGILLSGCTKLTLDWAALAPDGPAAAPPALRGVETPEAWTAERARLREAFSREVYGRLPETSAARIEDVKTLDRRTAYEGAALLRVELAPTLSFAKEERAVSTFVMNVLRPEGTPRGVVLMQTFCPRWDTIPHPAIERPEDASGCGASMMAPMMRYVFGRFIATPPLLEIIARGYAVATIFPSEFVPDDKQTGLAELLALSPGDDPQARMGAIGAWALAFGFMTDAAGEIFGESVPVIAYGHSRYAKAALLAAALDERIDAVIAHQSGTGGASLNRAKKGESVEEITTSYPHWFSPAYARFAGREREMSVDQHQLLAMIAPRPILLGNARRDVWSDPNGAFRAAMGADPVYELLGSPGLEQERLDEWRPAADIAFWIRPGTHGVVEEDWPAFLEFLDARFAAK